MMRTRETIKVVIMLRGDIKGINNENNTDMKKIAFLVSLTFVALSVAAQSVTSTSRIVLSHSGQSDKEVNMLLSSSFSDAFDNTWDAVAANTGGIYVYYENERYSTWASNKYSENLAIGFGTYDDAGNLNYTLKFQNFKGAEYTLYDRKTATTINVNASTPDYNFTIDLEDNNNPLITNRFLINYVVPDFEICFRDNQLQITANPYDENVVVKDANDTKVVDVAPVTPYQAIDLSAQAAGRYTVELAGGARKFIIVKQ